MNNADSWGILILILLAILLPLSTLVVGLHQCKMPSDTVVLTGPDGILVTYTRYDLCGIELVCERVGDEPLRCWDQAEAR